MGLKNSKIVTLNNSVDLKDLYASVKTDDDIETAIKLLLANMTLKEKIGQLQQISYGDEKLTPEMQQAIANGEVGSFLNLNGITIINEIQKISVEGSRLKIPQLIGKDVIHGFKTMMPIPLGQAATFDTDMVQASARVSAIEASSTGIKWTFSPMVDIARDPRWGRIAEGFGEDPYLASKMGVAMLKGYQGKDLTDLTSIAACGKHYVGYGATEGGRDYNTTLIPENTLRDVYLPPFKALAQNGCLTYMSAFNDLNGVPSSANEFTLKTVLRKEWGFKGLVVSDYTAIWELINHGIAKDEKEAAEKGFNGGVDMEMVSDLYRQNLPQLIDEGKVKLSDLDVAVSNILRVKFKLNIFVNPYTDPSRQSIILNPKHLEQAKNLAVEAPVLLQNKNNTLPISKAVKRLAVIGPLADDKENQIGTWAPDGNPNDCITPLTSLKAALPNTTINYSKGLPDCRSTDTSLFNEAVNAAMNSDVVLLFLGEDNGLSGESNCRAFINLPGAQEALIEKIAQTGKPIALVIYAGRSLVLTRVLPMVNSVLYSWHLGTMAGPALADLLLGVKSPSGKLPLTFLREQGQIPLYYNKKNTGRPNNTHSYQPFTSSYIDIDSTPLFHFGFGLSYSTFSYSNIKISKTKITPGETIMITATLRNDGGMAADEVSFLFVRDLFGSYTRPVKELKGFRRTSLKAGESTTLVFLLSTNDLVFFAKDGKYKAEAGMFQLWVAANAEDQRLTANLELTADAVQGELMEEEVEEEKFQMV